MTDRIASMFGALRALSGGRLRPRPKKIKVERVKRPYVARATSSDRAVRLGAGLCSRCGKPRDSEIYSSKRQYPYCKSCKAAYTREWRKGRPLTPTQRIKDKVRSTAGVALRRGKITRKPCQKCGSEKSQMHHHDYSKPLEVEWLCRPCHLWEHYGPESFRSHTSSIQTSGGN